MNFRQQAVRLIGIPQLTPQPAQVAFAPLYLGEAAVQTVVLRSVGTAVARISIAGNLVSGPGAA